MGESLGYAGLDSLDMSWLCHCRGLSREQCVLQCLGESEGGRGGCHTQYPLRAGVEVYR
jgi:hypothetical protein